MSLLKNSHVSSQLRRSFLYVPTSSDKFLQKSLLTDSDIIIYDLEDSVAPSDKGTARARLQAFLSAGKLPESSRIAVRVNDVSTDSIFEQDMQAVLRYPAVSTLVLPKIHSVAELTRVSDAIHTATDHSRQPLRLVASIESAKSIFNIGSIASWKSEHTNGGVLDALQFAAEDYCADTRVIRTKSRRELLFTRSQIPIASKAFGLDAIDMVCVDYKNQDYLREECQDGRELGFTGKQAIHPDQVSAIQSTFVPTTQESEIERAAKIVHHLQTLNRGAYGLDTASGGKEMIDAPMLKQATNILRIAKQANIEIPRVQ